MTNEYMSYVVSNEIAGLFFGIGRLNILQLLFFDVRVNDDSSFVFFIQFT